MLKRKCFVSKIRRMSYRFKREAKNVSIWRKAGETDCVSVPRSKLLTDIYVRSTLRQKGLSRADIDQSLAGLPSCCFS